MRTVAVLLHDGMRLFDYAVVQEVFGVDRTVHGVPRFTLLRCSTRRRSVTAEGSVTIRADRGMGSVSEADLVLVPGNGDGNPTVDPGTHAALRAAVAAGAPVAALCSGAFVLAAAGLLAGRRATTHWSLTGALAEAYPATTVESGPLWVHDGPVWTSAGTAAGLDLCLHLVRLAHGAAVATTIARQMVTPPHRDGNQAQYVPHPIDRVEPGPLTGLLSWARQSLDTPLTVASLARRAHQSPRTFARRFTDVTGTTPLRWVQQQRVQLAQELLESTDLPVDDIARRCGFGTTAVLRRHFGRDVGTTPTAYRTRFAARETAAGLTATVGQLQAPA
ncbi:MAG: helix-turn-helix domain-containing protein [Actinocatenispora sp.]